MTDELILASLSPYRAQLLKNAGLCVTVEGSGIDERSIEKELVEQEPGNRSSERIAQKLAEEKARDVSRRFPQSLVIGCDQILDLAGKILHKPADMEAAHRRLLELSGKTHTLRSAVCLFKNGQKVWSCVATAEMTVRPLDPRFVGHYLARVGTAVLSSVGAYQIEGEGIQLFEKINGDYFTIMGLPLLPLLAEFRKLGVIDG